LVGLVILALVLVPVLWLGRDTLPPRIAKWAINTALDAPVVDTLVFKIGSLGLDGLEIRDLALNEPEGPRVGSVAIDYDWRALIHEGTVAHVRLSDALVTADLSPSGEVALPGLDPILAALSALSEGASGAEDGVALPPVEIASSALSLSGAVSGLVGIEGRVIPGAGGAGTLISADLAPDLSLRSSQSRLTGAFGLEAEISDAGGAARLRVDTVEGSAFDGMAALEGAARGSVELGWGAAGLDVLSVRLAGPGLRLTEQRFEEPWIDFRLENGGISATASASLLGPDGVSIPGQDIDVALSLDAPPPGMERGGTPRRALSVRGAFPLAAVERLLAKAVELPSLRIQPAAIAELSLRGGLPWPIEDPAAAWREAVLSGGLEFSSPPQETAPGALQVGSRIDGTLALAMAAGRLSVETAGPFRVSADLAALADAAFLTDTLTQIEEAFGPHPMLSLGGEGQSFAVTVSDIDAEAGTLALRGPVALARSPTLEVPEPDSRVDIALDLVLRKEAAGLRLTRPGSISVSGRALGFSGAEIRTLDAKTAFEQTGEAWAGTYTLESGFDDPGRGVTGGAVTVSGGYSVAPDRVVVDIANGGSVAVRRLTALDALRPIVGLVAAIPKAAETPAFERVRDPDTGAWTSRISLPLRPRPLKLVSAEGGAGSGQTGSGKAGSGNIGPALEVDPGRIRLTGEIDEAGTGTARIRLSRATARLASGPEKADTPAAFIEAQGLAADLRVLLTDGEPSLERMDLAAARVMDQGAEITRFVPLSMQATARPAPTARAPHRLRFFATLRGVSGAFVIDAKGTHDPDSSVGRADVTLYPLQFTPGGLQPADISPAASAFLGEASGSIEASGAVRWPRTSGTTEARPFTVTMTELSFTGSLGEVLGLNGAVTLSDIDPPTTPPGQLIQAASIDPGLPIESPSIRFRLTDEGMLLLEQVDAVFAEGTVSAADHVIPLDGDEPISVNLKVEKVDADALSRLINLDGLAASGTLSGDIPLVWDPARGLSITNAALGADGDGGFVRYRPETIPGALQAGGDEVSLMLDALKNLIYQRFAISADGRPGETFQVKLNINGSNPDLYDGQPVDLNVTLSGRLDELFRDVRRVVDIPDTVRKQLEKEGASGG
jgi:hypothetical protein